MFLRTMPIYPLHALIMTSPLPPASGVRSQRWISDRWKLSLGSHHLAKRHLWIPQRDVMQEPNITVFCHSSVFLSVMFGSIAKLTQRENEHRPRRMNTCNKYKNSKDNNHNNNNKNRRWRPRRSRTSGNHSNTYPIPGRGNACVWAWSALCPWPPCRTATPPSGPSRKRPGKRSAERLLSSCRHPVEGYGEQPLKQWALLARH